jgi:hypothetical protein
MDLKATIVAAGVAIAALAGPAMAGTNILPGSGDTVTASSIHSGFDPAVAAGNLINGTNNGAFGNGDSRWVFADGSSVDQTLIVNLGSEKGGRPRRLLVQRREPRPDVIRGSDLDGRRLVHPRRVEHAHLRIADAAER